MSGIRKGLHVRAPRVAQVVSTFCDVCVALDTPRSLACYLMARYGEWDQLVSREIRPIDYLTPAAFKKDYLAVSVLSKAEFLPTSFDRREAAKVTFLSAERLCEETNERLRLYAHGKLLPVDIEISKAITKASGWIRYLLGDDPDAARRGYKIGVERRVASLGTPEYRFGPGSTSLVSWDLCSANKYTREIHVTPRLYSSWRDVVGPTWARHIVSVSLVASNRVTFVPKNAKTFRSIAVEPHLNGYAQLGVAQLLRHRLKRLGIDLSVQPDLNREAARRASVSDDMATIDLSSASDTVSREAVWLLLPEKWADLLDRIRSPYGVLDGLEFEYEKFSSMGNGTTFELETIIFRALCLGCGSSAERTQVFGDDLVVEAHAVPLLMGVLRFMGFTVNEKKTFIQGPFRESCGVDSYRGSDVRPFFWKDLDVTTWFKMANDIRQAATDPLFDSVTQVRLGRAWAHAVRSIPGAVRLPVPVGFNSSGVVVTSPRRGIPCGDGHEGRRFKALVWKTKRYDGWHLKGALLASLDGKSLQEGGKISFRDDGYWKVGWVTARA